MAAMTMRRQSIAIASPRAQGGKERHGFMGGAAAAAAATAAHEADMKRKAKTPIKKRRSAIKLSSSALNLAALPPTEEDAEYDELEPGGNNNGQESREDTEDGAEDALLPGTPTR